MKTQLLLLTAVLFAFVSTNALSAVLYVDLNGGNPVPPYTNWSTAAITIQDAIDSASSGDDVLVTNGVYGMGGRVVYGLLTNRVVVDKAITVQSVNGPTVTLIEGHQMPGTTNGDSAVRCVYLTNNAILVGFTLTNGATRTSGDSIQEQSGGGAWCESIGAVVFNCALQGNTAYFGGGGIYNGSAINCVLGGNNSKSLGGGAYNCMLLDSTLFQNSTVSNGGGAYGGSLYYCALSNNSANYGGGAAYSVLDNCALMSNSAPTSGGATVNTALNGCILTGNLAGFEGGGAIGCAMNDCQLTNNSAYFGGGVAFSTLTDCILAQNSASQGAEFGTAHLTIVCWLPTQRWMFTKDLAVAHLLQP